MIASSVTDASAFGEIFDRHFAEIHRYLGRRVGTVLADELAAETGADPVCDESSEVERRVDAVAAAPQLAAALASLSGGEREVLLLFAWADLSYDEISAALGIPVGTVRSRLSRARAHVRELMWPTGQVSVDGATEGGTNE